MEPGRYSARGLVATMQAVKSNPGLSVQTGQWTNPILTNTEYRAWIIRESGQSPSGYCKHCF